MDAYQLEARAVTPFISRSTLFLVTASIHTLAIFFISLLGVCMPALVGAAVISQADPNCPSGTLPELHSGRCVPVRDVTANGIRQPSYSSVMPPSLLELRRRRLGTTPTLRPALPPPGGIGAGIIYKTGALQAINGSELQTNMIVHPEGLNPSNLGLQWLFTTASNRSEKGVEVVGIYYSNNPNGSLGIFDWSCSSDYPCMGQTAPAWVWITGFTNLACYIKRQLTDAGYAQNVMQYTNQTNRIANGSPPSWENAVYLHNYCDDYWDVIYQHQYTVNQQDCSAASACAWWGPIIETFPSASGGPFPEINNLGFEDTALLHDCTWSHLSPAEPDSPAKADFGSPNSPWLLFFLDPQRDFEVGNYVTELTAQDCESGGWKQFGFTSQAQCINYVNSD